MCTIIGSFQHHYVCYYVERVSYGQRCRACRPGPTLQALHPVQLGEELVDHAVCHPCVVVAPPGGQGVKLIEEEDAGRGGLGPTGQREEHRSILKSLLSFIGIPSICMFVFCPLCFVSSV